MLAALSVAATACDESTSVVPDGPGLPDGGPMPDVLGPDGPQPDGPAPDGPASDSSPPDLAPDVAMPDLPPPDLLPLDTGLPDTVGWDILTTTGKDYVVNRFIMPNAATGSQYGVDLDNDGIIDNSLGSILGALGAVGPGLDVQEQMDEAVYSGSLLQLVRIFAKSLVNDPGAVLQTWAGAQQTCCQTPTDVTLCGTQAATTCFSGSHTFSPDPADPQGTLLVGAIVSGGMLFKAPTMKLRIPFGAMGMMELDVKAAQIKGAVSGSGIINGVVAGAITQADVQNKILPAIATSLTDTLNDPTVDAQTKAIISGMFDTNSDGTITTQEVASNIFISTFLSGDVDVDNDGVMELSVGMGYTAVPAVITP